MLFHREKPRDYELRSLTDPLLSIWIYKTGIHIMSPAKSQHEPHLREIIYLSPDIFIISSGTAEMTPVVTANNSNLVSGGSLPLIPRIPSKSNQQS